MTPDERAAHKHKLLSGLETTLRLLPTTTEDGALFLFNISTKSLAGMRHDGLLDAAEAQDVARLLAQALREAHPSLAAQLAAGEPLRSPAFIEMMQGKGEPEPEQVSRVRAALQTFSEHGLRKPH